MTDLAILMVTYDQPQYVELALPRLLDSCDDGMRVWLWHNGTDEATLEVSRRFAADERVARFHHSVENRPLREPLNWLFQNSGTRFVSKVDDDCLVAPGWAQTLAKAHDDVPEFGVLGSWRFHDEDFDPELSAPKMAVFAGHELLRNLWVQGSGFVMKRACIERHGLIPEGKTFTQYCVQLGIKGWVNGWYYPFVREEHMDDPRSPHSRLLTDEDLQARLPLTAKLNGITTLPQWEAMIRRSARSVQEATLDPRAYHGWRSRARSLKLRLRRLAGKKSHW